MGGSCASAEVVSVGSFDQELLPEVQALVSGRVRQSVSAASLTTLAVGGPLRAVVTVESENELQAVRSLLAREGQSVEVLGFGSNVLVSDAGLNSWVITLGANFRNIVSGEAGRYTLSGAVSLMSVARKLSSEGLSGLEFAAGIPASVGGAVWMNAGAHGAEIGERIVTVRGVLADGRVHEWSRDELPWTYRSSGLPSGVVVTAVQLALVAGDRDRIAKSCADNLAHRRATQPLSQPSAGSVFKNPAPETPAGLVLERAGVKGIWSGGAQVSELHANWIVNPEKKARAADVHALIAECVKRAEANSGLRLHPEVRMWGER